MAFLVTYVSLKRPGPSHDGKERIIVPDCSYVLVLLLRPTLKRNWTMREKFAVCSVFLCSTSGYIYSGTFLNNKRWSLEYIFTISGGVISIRALNLQHGKLVYYVFMLLLRFHEDRATFIISMQFFFCLFFQRHKSLVKVSNTSCYTKT